MLHRLEQPSRFLCLLALFTVALTAPAAAADRPNVVVILVDDMGYSDLGCYGGEIETPHLDQLAADGLKFRQFYNCARCCPTRACLLTGAYPHRVGLAQNGRTLSTEAPTLAERLKDAGYETAMAGKWHLSALAKTDDEPARIQWMNHQRDLGVPFADPASYPVHRGFDHYYGVIWGVVDFFDPFSLVEGNQAVETVPKDYYITDAITDHSVQYVQHFSGTDAPFFLYVAYTAPHWPIHARPKDIAKYNGRYRAGWDALRRDRFARQVKLGLFDANMPVGEVQTQRVWDSLSSSEQEFQAAKMAVHAAMVDRVDQNVGRLVAALRQTEQFENTLLVFLSDNGASPEIPGKPGYDRNGQTRDGRTAWRDADLQKPGHINKLGSGESYTGIGQPWASATNTPLRYWKKESYEGGCRTPCFLHWPAGLKSGRGAGAWAWNSEVAHVMDIAPTCLAAAEVSAKGDFRMDGRNLLPLLRGNDWEGHDVLFFEHVGGRGIRRGHWKAAALNRQGWELFDLHRDPGETKNLAEQHSDVLRSLIEQWTGWWDALPPTDNRRGGRNRLR